MKKIVALLGVTLLAVAASAQTKFLESYFRSGWNLFQEIFRRPRLH